eukprot:15354981-Ditylum_brightwellii.AAC.1
MTVDSMNSMRKILEGDCWQHMRNIIFNGIEIEMKKYLTTLLEEDITNILPHLRIDLSLASVSRACDKEFGTTYNYAKGHGSDFIRWLCIYRSGKLLMPTICAQGETRQDGLFKAALSIFMGQ